MALVVLLECSSWSVVLVNYLVSRCGVCLYNIIGWRGQSAVSCSDAVSCGDAVAKRTDFIPS